MKTIILLTLFYKILKYRKCQNNKIQLEAVSTILIAFLGILKKVIASSEKLLIIHNENNKTFACTICKSNIKKMHCSNKIRQKLSMNCIKHDVQSILDKKISIQQILFKNSH